MVQTIFQFVEDSSQRHPNNIAICHKDKQINYLELWQLCVNMAAEFTKLGIQPGDRIAIYLPKLPEAVYAIFSASLTGTVFVPINPVLKASQVAHILKDSGANLIVTSINRLKGLEEVFENCPNLKHSICVDVPNRNINSPVSDELSLAKTSKNDLAAILYTSGSTGLPKGVMLTQQNLVIGAKSVVEYLEINADDRILALLPFSFDYGLNQIISSFAAAARVVLFDYLLPRDVVKAIAKYQITGLAAVPPLWQQLAALQWHHDAAKSMRYFTNSGGVLNPSTLARLREIWPQAKPVLMYGLTEAFRSTYLPHNEIDNHPGSMGIAIPNAEVYVLHEDGTECAANETGELVHLGELVSPGYWQNPEKTAKRFKPVAIASGDIGVWSGDQVFKNEQGYLFFVSRLDEMIKTSGYRVSPGEIESELVLHPAIKSIVVTSAKHPKLGEGIIALIEVDSSIETLTESEIRKFAMKRLANFMLPHHIEIVATIPTNANGKFDRALLKQQYQDHFVSAVSVNGTEN